jgi:hypothetical protein
MKRGLRFKDECVLDNGWKISGDEIFLRGLYELVSGEDQHNISANVFGREQTAQSRCFKYFINHLYDTFYDLLYDNLQWWKDQGFIAESSFALAAKLVSLGLDGDTDCAYFIDCNCLQTSRVGGGPREDGPHADRWDSNVQRAFYNGWKSIHGLKHQTISIAHGFTVHLFGPTSLRRSDLKLLEESAINDKLAALGVWFAFGDSIYPWLSHIRTYYKHEHKTARQAMENRLFKSVRIAIEWTYGGISNLFAYLRNLSKLKLLRSSRLLRVYFACVLLRNCHVALYGGIESNYFEIVIPNDMLELYLNQTQTSCTSMPSFFSSGELKDNPTGSVRRLRVGLVSKDCK